MQRMGQIKDIADGTHHRIFSQIYRSIERRISTRAAWYGATNKHDVSGIVFDPNQRLMMEPGETFAFGMNWNPLNKQNKAERPVIAQGTPYGVVVITYPVELKTGQPFSAFSNIDHATVYATDNFWAAATRFAVLNSELIAQVDGWKPKDGYRGKALEKFVKCWLLTTHFHAQIQAQAELDKSTSFAVGDGIPLPEIKPRPTKSRQGQANMKANHNRRRQSAANALKNPNASPDNRSEVQRAIDQSFADEIGPDIDKAGLEREQVGPYGDDDIPGSEDEGCFEEHA